MPLREGGAKLWFKTKEEQDEFDDKMIASVVIQSPDYEDPNFTPIFIRKREESHLRFSDFAAKEIKAFDAARQQYTSNLIGKRDHTYWRDIVYLKYGMSFGLGYLLLRELPIRNLYARAWIMFVGMTYMLDTSGLAWIGKGIKVIPDPFLDKDLKNYTAFNDAHLVTPPSHQNKLPEYRLWKLNQPGHLAVPTNKSVSTAIKVIPQMIFGQKRNFVPWDGTFNMPVDSLANPRHKDAQWTNFRYV